MKQVFISTTNSIEGSRVLEYKGIVTTNIIAGTGFFSDFAASFTDFFGGRSGTYKRQMSTIYDEAIEELSLKALQKGANAILGFKIDFDSISAKNMSMFMISVTGTAVLVQENTASGHIEEKKEAVTVTALKNELNKRHIIDTLNKKNFICEKDWELVFQNPSEDYAFSLCKSASDYYVNNNSALADDVAKYFSHLGEYLSMIKRPAAITAIYSILESTPNNSTRLIKDISLFDAVSIQNLISSGKLALACNILDADKDVYTKDDLIEMEKIITMFDNLPDVGKIAVVKGGMLSKEKEKYICQHGHYSDKDAVFCETCNENIKGLTFKQVAKIEAYRQKVESLKFLFQ